MVSRDQLDLGLDELDRRNAAELGRELGRELAGAIDRLRARHRATLATRGGVEPQAWAQAYRWARARAEQAQVSS